MFLGNHPRTQKPVSECYVIQQFMGTIVE